MDVLQENLQGVFDKPLAQSIKSRKKIAQADEIAQLAKEIILRVASNGYSGCGNFSKKVQKISIYVKLFYIFVAKF